MNSGVKMSIQIMFFSEYMPTSRITEPYGSCMFIIIIF